jgi:DNA-binding NarL/FixJ family response regulator
VFTINKHVSNILRKMDATSRTEASTRTLRERLLE